ncbi:hypothetical protein AVI51_15810 (plasmid) [Piscirickettsia salmonis]|uniref:Nucleoid occlusion protein n=1 Tax=Piscirickettsia salmonis TaxID=1238 RepID=A0A9Q5VCF6_PISSA|nr:ParB/RepB/Spo0J family partition protein [Piscirickettsia salmonis]APS46120.1 hypothetical protein AVI48_17110 [Piscirickettsia salmonis]APS49117.1 hypothetical protein AVI49_15745 [Piscirickettsia salmonis]APS55573.1 hypothetical protein AVI51_15810 [Piscirickettsia salmonis]APS58894.1 hypothetical protein AVI52_16760 [Piscirickettsia salmonis]ERL60647.1 parB/RepB/Spo0J family partition domain protein [Piscirickettsia salmonis LF-89 = ATCC VR-1361]
MAVVRKRNKKKKPKLKGEQDFVEATVFSRELWAATNEIKIADIKIDRNIKDDKAIKSLASSMEGKRQINACIVRESSDGGYELISGECRYEAAKINQEPLLVRVVECSDEEAAQIIIAENEQRVDLCDYDKALTYVEYMKMFNIKSIRDFSKQFKVSKTQVGRLLQVDSIPDSVREVLPMEILGASQIEELAKRTKNSNPQSDCYEEGIISLSHKLSRVGTRSGSGLLSRVGTEESKGDFLDWKTFIAKVDRKVNPPEKPPQKKIERYVFSSEKANLRYTDSGFIVKSEKLTRKQKEQIQEALDAIL